MKIKELFTRLIRKFGYELIIELVPKSQRKLLNNIRKIQERAKRRKNEGDDSDDDEQERPHKPQPESIDELLQDSDSDMDDDSAVENKKKNKQTKAQQNQSKQRGGAWLKEDEDIVDFMDSSVANKVITTRPEGKSTNPSQRAIKHNFKTTQDGRLIITESEEKGEKISKKRVVEDDLDDLFESMEAGPLKKRKRNMLSDSAMDDNDDDSRKMKYKAGGGGIHRSINKFKDSTTDTGKEYKSKKGVGDVKKSNKVDPYAYLPLQFQSLNKRKKMKSSGQFKNLVKGARKGAQKGQKQKKNCGKK
jgi:ribosomal RNA-processing protein 12